MRFLIYNFGGLPGDLYQLVPDKFLATLCAVLNRARAGSAMVWDRGNLHDAESLLPSSTVRAALKPAARRLFRHLAERGAPSLLDKAAFGGLSGLADRQTAAACRRMIERDVQRIDRESPEAVFVNLRHGPGFGDSMNLARMLRQARPDLRLFAIGHRASWFARELADRHEQFDAFVVGPSSYATMAALAAGADPADVVNTVYRRDGEVHATERDFSDTSGDDLIPDYSPDVYRGSDGQLAFREVVLANEACPYSCHFCIRPCTYGTKWEARDPSLVADEVEHHVRQGIRCFRFSDSTPPPGALTALAEELLRRGLHEEGLHISSFGRGNRNMREDYSVLRQAGFEAMFFGVESGSQRVLDGALGKKIRVEEVRETIRQVHDAGILAIASFIFPTPGETPETMRETLDLLAELKPYLAGALVQPAGVYPRTPWHLEPERFGTQVDEDYVQRAIVYPIEPLKPLRFWKPFPFRYNLMGKPAAEVQFRDIVDCFTDFTRRVWGAEEHGGLGIPSVQDYGHVLARRLGREAEAFSREAMQHMVARDVQALAVLCGIGCVARPSGSNKQRRGEAELAA